MSGAQKRQRVRVEKMFENIKNVLSHRASVWRALGIEQKPNKMKLRLDCILQLFYIAICVYALIAHSFLYIMFDCE